MTIGVDARVFDTAEGAEFFRKAIMPMFNKRCIYIIDTTGKAMHILRHRYAYGTKNVKRVPFWKKKWDKISVIGVSKRVFQDTLIVSPYVMDTNTALAKSLAIIFDADSEIGNRFMAE